MKFYEFSVLFLGLILLLVAFAPRFGLMQNDCKWPNHAVIRVPNERE